MNHVDYYASTNQSGGWRRYGRFIYGTASLILYMLSLIFAYRYTGAGFAIAGGAGMCAFLCSVAGLVHRGRPVRGLTGSRMDQKEKIARVMGLAMCGVLFVLLLCTYVSGLTRR